MGKGPTWRKQLFFSYLYNRKDRALGYSFHFGPLELKREA